MREPALDSSFGELQSCFVALTAEERLVAELFPRALAGGELEEARKLEEQLQAALDAFRAELTKRPVELPDKRTILRHEHEGLRVFADRNGIDLEEEVLKLIEIQDGSVRKVDFKYLGLCTLEGLNALTGVLELDISVNDRIASLEGIPTTALTELRASNCGLVGDLSALQGASKLELLNVSRNPDLTSLSGAPVGALKKLYAASCKLTGDLTVLQGAVKLELLYVSRNPGLTSLEGLPLIKLLTLYAEYCGLSGDLSLLRAATKLKQLYIEGNPDVDKGGAESVIAHLKSNHSLRGCEI